MLSHVKPVAPTASSAAAVIVSAASVTSPPIPSPRITATVGVRANPDYPFLVTIKPRRVRTLTMSTGPGAAGKLPQAQNVIGGAINQWPVSYSFGIRKSVRRKPEAMVLARLSPAAENGGEHMPYGSA
jgi:hypothetical protein